MAISLDTSSMDALYPYPHAISPVQKLTQIETPRALEDGHASASETKERIPST